jgi:hypothetical protein
MVKKVLWKDKNTRKNPMQFALLDRERKKKKAEMSTETPNPFPNSRLGGFTRVRYPLVARAEPSNSVQEKTNKMCR